MEIKYQNTISPPTEPRDKLTVRKVTNTQKPHLGSLIQKFIPYNPF